MSKRIAIKASSLPPRPPVLFTAVAWLLLDRFDAPSWAFGVMWTLVSLGFIGFAISLHNAELKDVPGFGEK